MKKGDTILYPFGFGHQGAIVMNVFGNYLKVKHKDFWLFGWHGYHDIIHKTRVMYVEN